VAGFVPGIGIIADVANAGVSAGRGNWVDAGINLVAAIPVLGDAVKGAKIAATAGTAAVAASKLSKVTNAAPKLTGEVADEFAEGSFSITELGWRGYPEGVPRPQGPFRILEGAEYDAARKAANQANQAIRSADRQSLAGQHIHEIQPIKFGGSPIDPANKIPLPIDLHVTEVTPWWTRLLRSLQGNSGESI
jgi:hypothetical protein